MRVHLPALDGLRFCAAIMVVIGHGSHFMELRGSRIPMLLDPLASNAMILFFVLSGFVMWINYAPQISDRAPAAIQTFAAARIARLLPMYLIALGLGVMAHGVQPTISDGPGVILTFLFGIQAWLPAINGRTLASVIGPAGHLWSISVELFLYSLFPIVVIGLSKARSFRATMGLAASILAIAFIAHCFLYFNSNRLPSIIPGDAMMWLSYYAPYTHVFEFLVGCIACKLLDFDRGSPPQIAHTLATICILVVVAVILMLGLPNILQQWHIHKAIFSRVVPPPAIGFLLFYLARYDSPLRRVLSSPVALRGGALSYSMYLLHPYVLRMLETSPVDASPYNILVYGSGIVVLFAAVTALSEVTFTLVENPGRKLLRRMLGVSGPSAPSGPATPKSQAESVASPQVA